MMLGHALPQGGSVSQICKRRRVYKKRPTESNARELLEFPAVRLPTLRSVTSWLRSILRVHLEAIISYRDAHESLMQTFADVVLKELVPYYPQERHAHMQRVIRAALQSRADKPEDDLKKPTAYTLEWFHDNIIRRNEEWCCA